MFLGPISKQLLTRALVIIFLCFLNPQELNTDFVDDKTNQRALPLTEVLDFVALSRVKKRLPG